MTSMLQKKGTSNTVIIHPSLLNEVGGCELESPYSSVVLSVHQSVDTWLAKMVKSHSINCFSFTPVIMKLHIQTRDWSRMCPSDF